MVRILDYLEALYEALTDCASKVYTDRPQAASIKYDDFIAIKVSSYVKDGEIDNNFDYHTGRVFIWCYVRDKQSSKAMYQSSIKKLDKISQSVQAKFPIIDTDRNVKFLDPKVMISDSDENGWHYILISARFTTYF